VIPTLPLPTTVPARSGPLLLRRATASDLPELVRLLTEDAVSVARGDGPDLDELDGYAVALAEILADGANEMVVGVGGEGEVVAMMQLTRIPGLARRGATRLQVETVMVGAARRSEGFGSAMIRWVVDAVAPVVGAGVVQLTSDRARVDARRFYEAAGFAASHVGFKLARPAPGRAGPGAR